VCDRCRVARGFVSRGVGLLLTPSLPAGGGLLLTRTNAITMLFMRYAIDVAFLDARGVVVALSPALRPWVLARAAMSARDTLELPVGALSASGTQVGDELVVEEA
jgi:uncharacterized membrane protein (UPF0127 family)